MRKYWLLLIYILSIIFISEAAIVGVRTQVNGDSSNNNDNYQVGQLIDVIVRVDQDYGSNYGTVEVFSATTIRNSGKLSCVRSGPVGGGQYDYLTTWDTSGFLQGTDYLITATFGVSIHDTKMMTLDSAAPNCNALKLTNSLGFLNIIKNGMTAVIEATITDSLNNITINDIKADLSDFGGGTAVIPDEYIPATGKALWNITASGMTGDGTIDISATTDSAGHSITGTTSRLVTYDATNPTIIDVLLTNSIAQENIVKATDNVTIVARVQDTNINESSITANLSTLGLGTAVVPDNYDGTWATWEVSVTVATSGNKTINITASDKAGNTFNRNHTVVGDVDAPIVESITIENSTGGESYIRNGETVTVTAVITEANPDINLIKANINQIVEGGGTSVSPDTLTEDSGSWIATWNLTSNISTNGLKTFTILNTSKDKAGNLITGTLTKQITGDKDNPLCEGIWLENSVGETNIARAGDTVEIFVTISDNGPFEASDIFVNLSELGGGASVNPTSYNAVEKLATFENFVIGSGVTEGNKDIWVTIATKDKAGNIVSSSDTGETILIDNTAPDITVIAGQGADALEDDYAKATDTITVEADITEINGEAEYFFVDASSLGLGNQIPADTWGAGTATWTLDIADQDSGVKQLVFSGYDKAGNPVTGELTFDIEIDAARPEVSNITIKNSHDREKSFQDGDDLTVTANITDSEGNLTLANIFADLSQFGKGASVNPDTYTGNIATWNIVGADGSEGNKTFTILATTKDLAGNAVTGTLTKSIYADNSSPDITARVPSHNSWSKNGNTTVEVTITETFAITSSEVKIHYKIGAGAEEELVMTTEDSSSPYTYKAVVPLANENFIYWVTGTDDAGNDITCSLAPVGLLEGSAVTVQIDNNLPVINSATIKRDSDDADYVKAGDLLKITVDTEDSLSGVAKIWADLTPIDSALSDEFDIPGPPVGTVYQASTAAIAQETMGEGTVEITIYVEDEVGYQTSTTASIYLSKNPAGFEHVSVTSDLNNDKFLKETEVGTVEIRLTLENMHVENLTLKLSELCSNPASPEAGFEDIEWPTHEPARVEYVEDDNTYYFIIPAITAAIPDRINSIEIIAEDKSGKIATAEVEIVVDKTPVDLAGGNVFITDDDISGVYWYKPGDRINLRAELDTEEATSTLTVNLSNLGGDFASKTTEPFTYSGIEDVEGVDKAVFVYQSDLLHSGLNEGLNIVLTVNAQDVSENTSSETLNINFDKTLPQVTQINYFHDRFTNELIDSVTSVDFPVDLTDKLFYNNGYLTYANNTRGTLEIIIQEANINADFSDFNLVVRYPGIGENIINIKDEVDATRATIDTTGAPDYVVTLNNLDLNIVGMNYDEQFELFVSGYDLAGNTIETKIIEAQIKNNEVFAGTPAAEVNPKAIVPTGYSTVTLQGSLVDLYAYNTGFDRFRIELSPGHFRYLKTDSTVFEINSVTKTAVSGNPANDTEVQASPYSSEYTITHGNNILYYILHSTDAQRHTGKDSHEVTFSISFEVTPLLIPEDNPGWFKVFLVNGTTGFEKEIQGDFNVNINSPVTSVVAESFPQYFYPAVITDNYLFIKSQILSDDSGFDKIIVQNNTGGGSFYLGEDSSIANTYIDNDSVFGLKIGSNSLTLVDNAIPATGEYSVRYQGDDTFEIFFGDVIDNTYNNEVMMIRYGFTGGPAPSDGSFSVKLVKQSEGLFATATQGNAVTNYQDDTKYIQANNNALTFESKEYATGAIIAEVNPGRALNNKSDVELGFTIMPNITTSNSGINVIDMTIPNFNVTNINDVEKVSVMVGSTQFTSVSTNYPSLSEVKVQMANVGDDLYLSMQLGRRVTAQLPDRRIKVNIQGNTKSLTGTFSSIIQLGDTGNMHRVTATAGNADGITGNNNTLNVKFGPHYDDINVVRITPDKVPPSTSTTFTLKVSPDYTPASNIDINKMRIQVPSTFPINDPVTVRNSVTVSKLGDISGSKNYARITSGIPSSSQALVTVDGNLIEVTLGDFLLDGGNAECTFEVKFNLISQSVLDEAGSSFIVSLDNTLAPDLKQAAGIVEDSRVVAIKTPGATANGYIEPVYVRNSKTDQQFKYFINTSVSASGEPVNKVLIDIPNTYTKPTADQISVRVDSGSGYEVAAISVNVTSNPIVINLNDKSINPGNSGIIEVTFTAGTPGVTDFPTGKEFIAYVDNQTVSFAVEASQTTGQSRKVFVTKPLSAFMAEVNPAVMLIDTEEILTVALRPTINNGDFGVDSVEITLPAPLTYMAGFDAVLLNGDTMESALYSVTDMGANKIRLNVNNKLNNLDLVELKFKVSSNNTRTSASVIVKAGADGIDFGTISATAANADGVTNNSNTLTFKTEGYPVNNLIAEITPKNVFAGETELFDYYFNFDIGADNEGADTFVIRTGDGYVPSSPATVSATVNGGPVPSTSILLGNDLVTTLTGAITAPGNYTVRIRFSCNTPAVSDTGKVFSSQVLRTGRNFGSNSVAGNADGNGANDQGVSAEDNLLVTVSNYITSVTAEISPNYANKNSQTMFSIYSKLVFEDEDSGINKLIVNFPTGYNFGSDSISNVKLYNALNEDLILINPLNYRAGEGPTNATGFDITTQSVIDKTSAVSVLKIVFSAKAPNAVDAPVGKNFGLKVTNTLNDTRQITASEGNAFDGVSGNSMNVICGETKVDSYTLNLISSRNGFYKIEFGAEFSGLMDSGVTPVVKVVSESDTSREIDFVNNIFEFNKYSGTAYIPVNDINYFNNKVKVVFEVMKNMFGGDLSENTIENIHVNPSFISAIFKAPISNNAMTLLVKASKNITSGFNVKIEQQNSFPRNITMARIDSEKNIYSGTYVVDLTKTGQAYIEVSGFDSDGIEGRDIAQFFVAGGGFNVNSAPVGNFTVSFDFDSNQENFIITEAEYEGSNHVINMTSGIDGVDSDNSVELEVYPGGLYMWPEVKFNKSVGVSSEAIDFGSKTGLFREEDGKMKFVSKLNSNSFEINKAGKYFIAKDNKAPQINFDSSIVEVLDNGSGIYNTEIELNGRKITISANGMNSQQLDLNSVLRGPGISGRQQQVTITTSDMLGNTINRVVNFVPTTIGNLQTVAYPNPASDYSIIKTDGAILAAKAVLTVYDTSGRLVFRTDIAGMSEFLWDLRDRRGRKLANGTYFYTVDIDGQKINGKLAVLK